MKLTTQDYLKKSLIDTQEKIRDFQYYAEKIDDEKISSELRDFAEQEAMQASKLNEWISTKFNSTDYEDVEFGRDMESAKEANPDDFE